MSQRHLRGIDRSDGRPCNITVVRNQFDHEWIVVMHWPTQGFRTRRTFTKREYAYEFLRNQFDQLGKPFARLTSCR